MTFSPHHPPVSITISHTTLQLSPHVLPPPHQIRTSLEKETLPQQAQNPWHLAQRVANT